MDTEAPLVEHDLHLGAQQQAVVDPVLAVLGDRQDVRGLQRGQGLGGGLYFTGGDNPYERLTIATKADIDLDA